MPTSKDVTLRFLIEATDRAGVQLQKIQSNLTSIGSAADKASASSKKMGAEGSVAANKYGAALDKLRGSFDRANKAGDKLMGIGAQLAIAGAALSATVFFPIKAATDFEMAMNGVLAVTAGAEDNFAALSIRAKELGATTKFTATEAAEGMRFLGMAGFSAREAIEAIGPALDLASAGSLTLAESADIASNVLSAFRLKVEELAHVADVLANTATSSNTNVQQLGEAMKYAGPAAAAAGVSIEETAAAIGILGNNGIQASMAGTQVRGMLIALSAPTVQARKVLKDLGVEIQKNTDGSIDLLKTMQLLGQAHMDLGQASQIFRRTAATGALVLAKSVEATKALTKANIESTGVAKEMRETMERGLGGALIKLKSALEGFGIAVGEKMLPVLTSSVEIITKVVQGAIKLADAFPALTKVVGLLATTFGGFLITAGASTLAIGALTKGVAALGKAMTAVAIGGLAKIRLAMAQASVTVASTGGVIAATRTAILAFGKSLAAFVGGPVGLTIIALGSLAFAWDKNKKAYNEWRESIERGKAIEEETAFQKEKTAQVLDKLNTRLGTQYESLEQVNRAIKEGELVWDLMQKAYVLAGDAVTDLTSQVEVFASKYSESFDAIGNDILHFRAQIDELGGVVSSAFGSMYEGASIPQKQELTKMREEMLKHIEEIKTFAKNHIGIKKDEAAEIARIQAEHYGKMAEFLVKDTNNLAEASDKKLSILKNFLDDAEKEQAGRLLVLDQGYQDDMEKFRDHEEKKAEITKIYNDERLKIIEESEAQVAAIRLAIEQETVENTRQHIEERKKLWDHETEVRGLELEIQVAQIEAAEAQGIKTAEEAAKEITELKRKELEAQLTAIEKYTADMLKAYGKDDERYKAALIERKQLRKDYSQFLTEQIEAEVESTRTAEEQKTQIISEQLTILEENHRAHLATIAAQQAEDNITYREAELQKLEATRTFLEEKLAIMTASVEQVKARFGEESAAYAKAIADMKQTALEFIEVQNLLTSQTDSVSTSVSKLGETAKKTKESIETTSVGFTVFAYNVRDTNRTLEELEHQFDDLWALASSWKEHGGPHAMLFAHLTENLKSTDIPAVKALVEEFYSLSNAAKEVGLNVDITTKTLTELRTEITERIEAWTKYKEAMGEVSTSFLELIDSTRAWQESTGQVSVELEGLTDKYAALTGDLTELTGKAQALVQEFSTGIIESAEEAGETVIQEYEDLYEKSADYLDQLMDKWEELTGVIDEASDEIKGITEEMNDAVLELTRSTMTDYEVYLDKAREYRELMAAGNTEIAEGEYEAAADFFQKALDIARDLGDEIKDESGNIVLSLEDAVAQAIEMIQKAGEAAIGAFSQMGDEASTSREEVEALIKKMLELANAADVKFGFQTGGVAGRGYEAGGKLPGYGGGDIVPAWLEPGEGILRKEVESKLPGITDYLNRAVMSIPQRLSSMFSGFRMPSFDLPAQRFQQGGVVKGMDVKDYGKVELSVGGRGYPILAKQNVIEELMDALRKESMVTA